MTHQPESEPYFDEIVARALAESVTGPLPSPDVRNLVLSRVAGNTAVPPGFAFEFAAEDRWRPYPVSGIRMKVLATNTRSGYATLLLDVSPGVRFPAHHHAGDEQCYVLSGSVHTLGRQLGPGDFLYASAGTEHGELWTDEGARVLLVVPQEEVPPDAGV